MSLLLSFDIGHSSIGWGVLSFTKKLGQKPDILGCGSVIFPVDDCLASVRRQHRRTRRNIRSTRRRIDRIRRLFLHLDVLNEDELNSVGHPAPFVLAARSLISGKPVMSWLELWHVLQWYAHNRGYDGNSRWARQDIESEDTEKEKAALELMRKHGTEGKSMAETICAMLGINPMETKISSNLPYKNTNAAFPRKIVRQEVLKILHNHIGSLENLDQMVVDALVAPDQHGRHYEWRAFSVPGLDLPKRYQGGLLFGQLVPRFDNRIIGRCPISGGKVPNKATYEFLQFRWAMILANLRVEGRPLTAIERRSLNEVMQNNGRLTAPELRRSVEKITGCCESNVKTYFELHPDATDALLLDPALALYSGVGSGAERIKPYWQCLTEEVRHRALGRWKKQRKVDLAWMVSQCSNNRVATSALEAVLSESYAADQKSKKPRFLSYEHFLNQSFAPSGLAGRAPYSRQVMNDVVAFVLSTDRHPNEAPSEVLEAGPLYRSKEVLSAERDRDISRLTNNHLIRQRLDILLRLVDHILLEFADNDPRRVSDVVVEVASDLQTYSGLTNEKMKQELGKRLSHFKAAVAILEKEAPDLKVNGLLIRKCRIAMDIGWKCPFTGGDLYPRNLKDYELEHIIPYSDRPTNALDALVLTYPWVNGLKGKRTAMAFINEVSGDQRFLTPKKYQKAIETMKVANRSSHPDDFRRQTNRKKLLLLDKYEAIDHGFTQGSLAQTSHLNRLSARQIEKRFREPESGEPTVRVHSIPGQVTAETRKAWKLLGTLAKSCPEILDEDGNTKSKTEIRSITHLHHALDAVTIALTHVYLPGTLPGQVENEKGAIWSAMLQRKKSIADRRLLMRTGMFASHQTNSFSDANDQNIDLCLTDLPKGLKEQLSERLAERRVVQHVPSDQSGSLMEETTWRYVCEHDGQAVLVQRVSRDSLKVDEDKCNFGWADLELKKAAKKLIKIDEIRKALDSRQIRLIQRGLMKITKEPKQKVVGLHSGKLKQKKAVRVLSGNYGISLGETPRLLPFHAVPSQLASLRSENGGKLPVIIRQGSIIKVEAGTWKGFWKVTSVKDSVAYGVSVDLGEPHKIGTAKGNARIPNMVSDGMVVFEPPLTGMACPDLAN